VIDEALWQSIVAGLPVYLDRQRWYADKLRPVSAIRLVDLATVEYGNATILLALVGIDYEIGDSRRYFVPMTVRREPTPERATIAVAEESGTTRWVQDAIGDVAFRDFLVHAGSELTLEGQFGVLTFEPWTMDGQPFLLASDTQSVATAFEQSNSSIAYGEQAIAKLYRRLEVGQNIEVDLNRYLASEAQFASIPRLIAAATYRSASGDMPLMLIQQHVGDHRDAWTALTELLRHKANGSLDIVEGLGRVTGGMHVALASAPAGSPLSPEPISEWDIQSWREAFLRSAEETDWITAERLGALPARSQQAAREYLASPRDWEERASWFELLSGLCKTRVHGDYHLGQILVTKDGRLLVVDFEGEPHRPAHERAAKYSPLRDVAGMLRSLNYAIGVVASSHDVQAVAASRSWLEHWERDARFLFMAEYRRAIVDSPVSIAPDDDEAFERVVTALETDKALYEVRYELSSRPDWAWLPLDSLR
jgi:maltose alpha-D-glucosyltransferase/alpha-amylase